MTGAASRGLSLTTMLFGLAALALVAGAFFWARSGTSSAVSAHTAVQVPPAISGKPNAAVGRLKAAVTDRAAPDRATVEAAWTRKASLAGCRVELMVPTGATLLEGERVIELGGDEMPLEGQARWVLDFPPDQDLDAVVLLCGQLGGHGAGVEWTVPLARAPTND